MGTGSSRGTTQIVAADESLRVAYNDGSNNKNVQPGSAKSMHVTGMSNGKTEENLANSNLVESNNAVKEKDLNSVTQDDDLSPSSSDPLLASFSGKYPTIATNLKTTYEDFKGLKDALENGELISEAAYDHVKGLFTVYRKTLKSKSGLREFVVTLGVPKLSYNLIVDCRKNYPALTTWDRGKAKGKEDEAQEDETGGGSKTEKTVLKENQDTEIVTQKSYKTQDVDEKMKEIKQTGLEEENETQAIPENQEYDDDKEKTDGLKMSQDIICKLLAALLNFSDLSDNFALACDEVGMVPLLIDMIKELKDSIPHHVKYVNAETQQLSKYTTRGRMLSTIMGILHNLSKRVPTRSTFSSCQALDVLLPLLKTEVMIYAAKSLLILAYLTDEENNHVIMAHEGPIKFLISLLKKSLTMVRHRYFGFSAAELAEGLTQIAVNDNNKKTIAQSGGIPTLVTMLAKAKGDEERLNACNALWTLAFDEDNRQEIKNNESALLELRKLLLTKNNELKRAAAGALWECEGKEKHAEEKELLDQEATDTKHVMISYQWDVQQSMIQLKNQLQAKGYKVWMDIDEMGGSTLESMASAVENATVVLVGVSQKYKESPNCRSEAEYTYQLHKDIIPLMMDYRYKPDGWLGIIVGSKFWIDFSERHKLDTNVDKLIRELGNRGKNTAQETVQATVVDLVDASPQTSSNSWGNNDVINWLQEVGLEGRLDSKAAQRLDGRMLLRLQDLRKESPEFFYSSIQTEFKLTSLFDVLTFTDELDKLAR